MRDAEQISWSNWASPPRYYDVIIENVDSLVQGGPLHGQEDYARLISYIVLSGVHG